MRTEIKDIESNLSEMKEILSNQGRAVYIILPDSRDYLCLERKTIEYAGYLPVDVVVLEYLEDMGEQYEVHAPEYYPAKFIDHAFDALKERVNHPITISSKAIPLTDFIVKA